MAFCLASYSFLLFFFFLTPETHAKEVKTGKLHVGCRRTAKGAVRKRQKNMEKIWVSSVSKQAFQQVQDHSNRRPDGGDNGKTLAAATLENGCRNLETPKIDLRSRIWGLKCRESPWIFSDAPRHELSKESKNVQIRVGMQKIRPFY